MRRVLFLVTIAAAVALRPGFVSSSALALGFCSTVFAAMALVLLEQSLPERTEAGTMADGTPKRLEWEDDEMRRICIRIGRGTGLYLFLGFAVASLVLENFPFRLWTKTGLYEQRAPAPANSGWVGIKLLVLGLLGAAKWAIVPFVVSGSPEGTHLVRAKTKGREVRSADIPPSLSDSWTWP